MDSVKIITLDYIGTYLIKTYSIYSEISQITKLIKPCLCHYILPSKAPFHCISISLQWEMRRSGGQMYTLLGEDGVTTAKEEVLARTPTLPSTTEHI